MRRSNSFARAALALACFSTTIHAGTFPIIDAADANAGAAPSTNTVNDFVMTVNTGDPRLKYLQIFGSPARWPVPYVWRYNDAGRPATISKTDAIAVIEAAAAQWNSACGVNITHNAAAPETTTAAQDFAGSRPSAAENVVGWGDLSAGGSLTAGVTHVLGAIFGSTTTLTDADITLSPSNNRTTAGLKSTAVHEFGHAIGFAHSNVSSTVMSGPASSSNPDVPATAYSGVSDLQPDDIQGCLCLYGAGTATAGKGYLCGLPSVMDFGTIGVGATSAIQTATLTNRATAANVTLGQITFSDPDFQWFAGCAPGTVLLSGMSCTASIVYKPSRTGSKQAKVQISAGTIGPYEFPVVGIGGSSSTGNTTTPTNSDVVEFYNSNLDNFFVTSNAAEQAGVLNGGAGPGWVATGERFKSGGSAQVCRFYGSISPGPNSHFYTIDPSECAGLKSLQATSPASAPRWNFESLDFASTPASGGSCPSGTTPVYRAYNKGSLRGIDSNHRITASFAAYQAQVAKGWAAEGVVMCAPA